MAKKGTLEITKNDRNYRINLEPIETMLSGLIEKSIKLKEESQHDYMTSKIIGYLGEEYDQEEYYLSGYKTKHYLRVFTDFVEEYYKGNKVSMKKYTKRGTVIRNVRF